MQPSEIWVTLAVFVFAGFILYLLAVGDRARIRYRLEVQKELIAKFSSSQELAEFLNSDAGKMLLSGSRIDDGARRNHQKPKTAKEIVGLTIAWGVLILSVGAAVLMIRGLTMVSALLISLGVGFQINAMLGYFFSKKWCTWDQPVGGNAPTHSS